MIDGIVDVREISINAQLFIRATNEDYIPANTYQIIDTTGAFYNLPAFPSEFLLIDLAGNRYTPATSEALIEDSKNLAPFTSSTANKANSDASNVAPYILEWHEALELYSRTQIDQMLLAMRGDSFHTGPISTTANSVQIALSPDGTNSATIAGTTLSKTTADAFPYTPVSPGKLKALVLYAKATAQIFYLAEGVQGDEAVSPDFEGLFIASITVSDGGQIVNPAGPQDFLYQSNDAWITQQISGPESLLVAGNNAGNTFDISVKTGAVNPGIAGITAEAKLFWEGRIFWLRNNSPVDIALIDTPVRGELTRFSLVQFEKPAVLEKAGWAAVKIKAGQLVVIGLGGGASFPEGGNPGDPLVRSGDGVEFSGAIPAAIVALNGRVDAEEVNRAAADLQEKNERVQADADERVARIAGDALKVDKPTTDGIWSLQKLGSVFTWVAGVVQNIANTDLTNLSARIFTQGNTFTWNTEGFGYYLKGLVDKTGQAAYSKVVVVHPTTGEKVTRDFDDAQATTSAIQKATTAQKSAMRIALLGTAVPASPVINHVLPLFAIKDEDQFLMITGINLTLLDPTSIYFVDSSSTRFEATSFYNISGTEVQTFWRLPSLVHKGKYPMKIQNGAVVQGASSGIIEVVERSDLITKHVLVSESVVRVVNDLIPNNIFLFAEDYIDLPRVPNSGVPPKPYQEPTITVKTGNFLLGNINSSWEVVFAFEMAGSGSYAVDDFANIPFGLTETTNSQFTSANNFLKNYPVTKNTAASINVGGTIVNSIGERKFIYRKTGNELMLLAFNSVSTNTPAAVQKYTINTEKDYALFFSAYNSGQNSQYTRYRILSIQIKN